MFLPSNEYADSLSNNTVRYLPSCVIIEMMTKLYSQLFAISLEGSLRGAVDNILPLLARMEENIRLTGEAYASRIRFFAGDWAEDKIRARRQFFNIMSHLGYVAGMVGHDDRDRLYGAIESLTEEWIVLDRTMDAQAKSSGHDTVCRYFRNRNPSTWRQTMANVILTLDEETEHREGEHLVLVCYGKMRRTLLATIDALERRRGRPGRFRPERIVAVSEENVPFSCPTCLEMTDTSGTQVVDEQYPESLYAETILKMRGAACPVRPRPRPDSARMRAGAGKLPDTALARLRARVRGTP